MSQFTSSFWDLYISIITIVSIVGCGVLLVAQSKRRVAGGEAETTGHTWDEDLGEYNNPLPRWWMWLFWITIVFGFVYLALYPGLGSYAGRLMNWLIMPVLFYGIFVPFGLAFRRGPRDGLQRFYAKDRDSYWSDRSGDRTASKNRERQY